MTNENFGQEIKEAIKDKFNTKVTLKEYGVWVKYNKGVRYCDYENMEILAQKICNHLEDNFEGFFEYNLYPQDSMIEIYYY